MHSPAAARPPFLTPNVVGVLWMLLAVTMLTGMFVVARHLMESLPMLEVGLFRFLMALLFYIPWLVKHGVTRLRSRRAPMRASSAASMRSVLASVPVASAKRRA